MYIDPSTGGQLAVILIAAFGAISGSILVFAGRIKMFFARKRRKGDELEEPVQDPSSEE
ncbi:MAG: hypothetical protein ABFS17_05525 [Chloroflexota bacterium]